MFINDGLVRHQLTRGPRHAMGFEIGAGADHERSAPPDFPRGESGVGKVAEA
jgi:hypothetical protein